MSSNKNIEEIKLKGVKKERKPKVYKNVDDQGNPKRGRPTKDNWEERKQKKRDESRLVRNIYWCYRNDKKINKLINTALKKRNENIVNINDEKDEN